MKRKRFLVIAGGSVLVVAGSAFLLSDKRTINRENTPYDSVGGNMLSEDEQEILFLASLAPSGHNTQPWIVRYIEPLHWIICNDKNRWLPAVDPTQRETILSLGTFIQNMEYAANYLGYQCQISVLAGNNQAYEIADVRFSKSISVTKYPVERIKERRTVRSNYLNEAIKKADLDQLLYEEKEFCQFMPPHTKKYQWLNEKTIEANKLQSYRDKAQRELAEWIRFSGRDALRYRDGLTTASMEVGGISGWVLRNFYDKSSVMKADFREANIDKVEKQVGQSGGWLIISSPDRSVEALLEAGKRMQRIFLKVRELNIALHPMTQILEESATAKVLNQALEISNPIQFIIRMGYLENYPEPVSLRRAVDQFVYFS